MRYQFDSYKLSLLNSAAKGSARVKVTMKAPVQPAILLNSINVAIIDTRTSPSDCGRTQRAG